MKVNVNGNTKKMPNDNTTKEQEKVGSAALNKLRDEGNRIILCISCLKKREEYIPDLCKECSDKMDKHIIQSKNATPNNYDGGLIAQDIEIEARESYQLKKSLGIVR